MAASAIWRLLI